MSKYSEPCLKSCTPYGHSQDCPNAKLKDLCKYDLMREVDQLLTENAKLKEEIKKRDSLLLFYYESCDCTNTEFCLKCRAYERLNGDKDE